MIQEKEHLSILQAIERRFAERLGRSIWEGDDVSAGKWLRRQSRARARINQLKKGKTNE